MNERNKSKTVRNIILGIVVVFLFAVIILGFFGYRYVTRSVGPLDPDSEEVIEVEIPTGATRRTIGGILEEEDVINSSFIFEYYVRFKGNNDFKAGTYLMSPSMSMEELMTYLNEGGTPIAKLPTGRVTLPEGIHLEDIADRIESQTDFTADDFMSLIQNEAFILVSGTTNLFSKYHMPPISVNRIMITAKSQCINIDALYTFCTPISPFFPNS